MKSSLIDRYSDAILEAAKDDGIFDELFPEVAYLARIIVYSPENLALLEEADGVPDASHQVALALIDKLDISPVIQRLMLLLAKRHRLQLLPEILHAAAIKMKELRNIIEATVTSVRPLDSDEQSAIQQRLDRITHHKADIQWVIDPEILGGVSIKIGDRLIDGTLKTQISRLKKHLLKPQGAR